MPRVNRDLQRRLAARRERERRRPSGERRYQFAPAQTEVDDELEEAGNGTAAASATVASTSTRRTSQPAAPVVEEDFSEEYAYVGHDLRRMGVVVSSLLVGLIALSFLIQR